MLTPTENYPHGRATIRQAVDFVDENQNRVFNKVALATADSRYNIATDDLGRALIAVDFAHHEVHEGEHFSYTNAQDLGNGATISFTLTTPNSAIWSHLGLEINGEAEYEVQLFEGATGLTSSGTIVTNPAVINSNRNSANTNTLIVRGTPTLGAGSKGTLIRNFHAGSGKSSGGIAGTGQENILKQNTIYWLDLINFTTSNNYLSWIIEWYEHISGS
jgi:hypothetical protein